MTSSEEGDLEMARSVYLSTLPKDLKRGEEVVLSFTKSPVSGKVTATDSEGRVFVCVPKEANTVELHVKYTCKVTDQGTYHDHNRGTRLDFYYVKTVTRYVEPVAPPKVKATPRSPHLTVGHRLAHEGIAGSQLAAA